MALLDLVLARTCPGCGVEDTLLCPTCGVALGGSPSRVAPSPEPTGFPRTWAVGSYEDPVRAVLIAHKERGRLGLARPIGQALASAGLAALGGSGCAAGTPVAVVPVPSSAAAVRSRGHDALARAARVAAGALTAQGYPAAVRRLLVQTRNVSDQAGLGAAGRARNLAGAHRVRGRARLPDGGVVLLVDDVVTTGSSLVEATRALSVAGRPPVAAAVVAATVRRLDRSGGTD